MKKKQLFYALLPALALLTGGAALASTTNSAPPNHFNDIVTAISQKFNLSSTDVQKVVDEVMQKQHAARQEQMTRSLQDRLQQAVKDGKINQVQADLVIAKHAEMKTFVDSLDGKTAAERETALKNQMAALKQWATDNQIPALYLMPMGPGRGMKGGMMHGRGALPSSNTP